MCVFAFVGTSLLWVKMANSANTAAESPVFFEENDNEIADVDPDMMYFINKTEFNSSVQKWKKVSNFVLFVMKKIDPD